MATPFGGPSPEQSFLVGLASSTMDAFKSEHDKNLAEDYHAKSVDYDLLMKALKTVQDDDQLTPSQRSAATQEIMQRSVDVFKPKGHGGIKENLKGLFGGGERYVPQGVGDILTRQRPVLDVETPGVVKSQGPAEFGNVTLPPPPDMNYQLPQPEKTYHEQELQDYESKQGFMLDRQMALEKQKELTKNAAREAQNKEVRERMRERFHLKSDAEADLLVKRQLSKMGLFEDTPANRALAAEDLRQEREQKIKESNSKVALNVQRVKGIQARIGDAQERLKQGWARIGQGSTRLAQQKQKMFDNDPQIKGSWSKVHEQIGFAKTAMDQAILLRSQYADTGDENALQQAMEYERQADGFETKAQGVIDEIQRRQDSLLTGGVLLSGPSDEDPQIRAFANQHFNGDYQKALEHARKTGYQK